MRRRGVLSAIVNLPEMHIPPWYWFSSPFPTYVKQGERDCWLHWHSVSCGPGTRAVLAERKGFSIEEDGGAHDKHTPVRDVVQATIQRTGAIRPRLMPGPSQCPRTSEWENLANLGRQPGLVGCSELQVRSGGPAGGCGHPMPRSRGLRLRRSGICRSACRLHLRNLPPDRVASLRGFVADQSADTFRTMSARSRRRRQRP